MPQCCLYRYHLQLGWARLGWAGRDQRSDVECLSVWFVTHYRDSHECHVTRVTVTSNQDTCGCSGAAYNDHCPVSPAAGARLEYLHIYAGVHTDIYLHPVPNTEHAARTAQDIRTQKWPLRHRHRLGWPRLGDTP